MIAVCTARELPQKLYSLTKPFVSRTGKKYRHFKATRNSNPTE